MVVNATTHTKIASTALTLESFCCNTRHNCWGLRDLRLDRDKRLSPESQGEKRGEETRLSSWGKGNVTGPHRKRREAGSLSTEEADHRHQDCKTLVQNPRGATEESAA